MSFSALRTQMDSKLSSINSIQDYKRRYLSEEVIRSIEQLNKKFVEHLFADLINQDLSANIRSYLTDKELYHVANDYALECVESAFYKSNIHGARIKSWTYSALKCFDVFLTKLIQGYLNERIKKSSNNPKERDVYDHLKNKGEHYYDIGIAFETIYLQRNSFTHIQYDDKDGYRRFKRFSRNKYDFSRDLILEQFEKGLSVLIKEIRRNGF